MRVQTHGQQGTSTRVLWVKLLSEILASYIIAAFSALSALFPSQLPASAPGEAEEDGHPCGRMEQNSSHIPGLSLAQSCLVQPCGVVKQSRKHFFLPSPHQSVTLFFKK